MPKEGPRNGNEDVWTWIVNAPYTLARWARRQQQRTVAVETD